MVTARRIGRDVFLGHEAEALLSARQEEVHSGIKEGKVHLDAELLSLDAAGFLQGSA